MYLVVLAVFVVLFSPRVALATTHISRLQIPLHKSTVIVEKKDEAITQKILVSDYLSSTKVVISDKEIVLNAPSYYPYGSSLTQTPLAETKNQYTGQRKVSDDSSVYNYNARYYNPTTGIFIHPDSVEGPARYSYVAGNPIMHNDPSGNVISYSFSQFDDSYPRNPDQCTDNITACMAANVDLYTGVLSVLGGVSYDSSGDWFDESLEDAKRHVSQDKALSTMVVNEGMGLASMIVSPKFQFTDVSYGFHHLMGSGTLRVNPEVDDIFNATLQESQARIARKLGNSEAGIEEIAKQISLETDRVFGGSSGYSVDRWRSIYTNASLDQRPAPLGEFISHKTGLCLERACYSAALSNVITPNTDSRVFITELSGSNWGHAFARYGDSFVIDTTYSLSNPLSPFARSSGLYDASEYTKLLSNEGHKVAHEFSFAIKFE